MTETNTDEWYCSKERRDRLTNSFSACYGIDVSLWHGGADLDYTWKASYPIPGGETKCFEGKCDESWQDYINRYFSVYKNKEEQMYVYDCIIVDKESDEIVFDGRLIASTSEQAKMMALADIMRESAPTNEVIANYHFVTVKVGEGYSK
jgi:hypothetical protein